MLKSPAELVRLDTVEMDEDDEILPDFEAEVDGRRVWVTAVLERTVVVEPAPGEPKVLVNRRHLMVDPGQLRVRHMASKEAARRGREAARQLRLQENRSAA
ncbi:MAG: hypothetical protein M3003_10575 [Candidatus Dormibacteraeota bacterium]|nr:hypothetical protein [Candidatus Dormibacteraeota bacterium]